MQLIACERDQEESPEETETLTTDQFLLAEAEKTEGYVYFNFSDVYLDKSSGSGHSQPHLRTRYNSIAAASLDASGRVKGNATFAEGSIIVKDLLNADKTINLYAILYKKSDHKDADEKGWVWGYVEPSGTIRAGAANKGSACISCHSQSGNIDYMLMNKFYP